MSNFVITLVQVSGAALSAEDVLSRLKFFSEIATVETRVLGPDALDVYGAGDEVDLHALQTKLVFAFGPALDVCVQAVEGRRKRLLLCDMDSTIIQQECIDELAEYAGIKDKIAAITERAMRGELDFEAALTERVGLLKGLPVSKLQACYDERIHLTPGARTLVQTMKANGAMAQLVSGGFTFFTSRVAEAVGFDANFANVLLDTGTELTGEVQFPILGKQAKLDRLNTTLSELGLTLEDAMTIGDGANDSAMIEAAGMGLGFNPHPVLAKAAKAVITGPSLETALYFQGYDKESWITG